MAKSSVHAGDDDLQALGQAIRRRRLELNISQEVLAHDAGVDRSYMSGIERGQHNVAIINLVKISRCLQLQLSELLRLADL